MVTGKLGLTTFHYDLHIRMLGTCSQSLRHDELIYVVLNAVLLCISWTPHCLSMLQLSSMLSGYLYIACPNQLSLFVIVVDDSNMIVCVCCEMQQYRCS